MKTLTEELSAAVEIDGERYNWVTNAGPANVEISDDGVTYYPDVITKDRRDGVFIPGAVIAPMVSLYADANPGLSEDSPFHPCHADEVAPTMFPERRPVQQLKPFSGSEQPEAFAIYQPAQEL